MVDAEEGVVEEGGVVTGCRVAGASQGSSSGATQAGQLTQAHLVSLVILHRASLVVTNNLVTLAMEDMMMDGPAQGLEEAGEGVGVGDGRQMLVLNHIIM